MKSTGGLFEIHLTDGVNVNYPFRLYADSHETALRRARRMYPNPETSFKVFLICPAGTVCTLPKLGEAK